MTMQMTSEKKFHIIFVNKLIKDVTYEEARNNLIDTFHLSEKNSKKLFSAKTACLSKTDIEENANKAVEMIREIGFESKILVKKPKPTSQISASAERPEADLGITRHIDSLKPRAQQLKEKISMFTGHQHNGRREFRRGELPPVPDNLNDYLNPAQQITIENMKSVGWSLFFVRRSNPNSPITMMILPTTGDTAEVARDGAFNPHHQISMRH
jgi:DNA gyrase/topoisomerase IV subunit A